MPRADRVFALVQFLSGPRFRKLEEITRELETTPRTVYRDLADLETRGYPIDRVEGSYRIALTATVKPLPLTDRERFLLAVSLENPALERQPSFAPAIRQLRSKLITAHGLDRAKVAREAGPDRSGEVPKPVVDALEQSIREEHSVSFLYASLSGRQRRWRGIDPWVMLYRCDAWYVVGRCHTNDEPRTFRLDRISAVLPIGTGFVKPAGFDPDRWFANSWGVAAGEEPRPVVIEFEESVATLILNAQHHPNERKRRLDDGRVEYRVEIGPLDELARWVTGFGGAARVIAPEELIERVRQIATGAAAVHQRRAKAAAMTRRGQ